MANAPCIHCGSTAGPEHPCPGKLIGKVLDNRYQIESVLGQGGMGMVFRATQVAVRRPVALKTLHPQLAAAPTFFERFRREAEVASRLNHPNIITIFDFGQASDGTCYFVMELVQGESLKQLVKRDGPLSMRRALGIVEQAARGLAHAHQQSVVHRDIKPHNLLVSQVDGADFVKILDFGLVKALEVEDEDQLTSTGQVLGTPQYMSPEQAGGEEVDRRSDLYSLGGVLYFCLTGASPFGANTVRKALTAALTQQVPAVASRRQGAPVPRAVDEFFRKALASDKENRHQSAERFIADLHEAIAGMSDEELDAMPAFTPAPRDGSGSEPKGSGRTPPSSPSANKPGSGSKSKSKASPSKAPSKPNVVVDPGALTISKPRMTAPEIPSLRGSQSRPPAHPEPEEPAQRSGGNQRFVLLGAALALFAIGGAVVVGLRKAPPAAEDKPTPAAASRKPEPTPPAPADKPAVSSSVLVKLHSTPSGAEVFEGTRSLGRTPVEISILRGTPRELTYRLEGYADAYQSLDLSHYEGPIKNMDVELQALPKPTSRPAPGPGRKKKDKSKDQDISIFE